MQTSGTVEAEPERIFALLADPAQHTELDGAGMVRGLDSGASPVTGVGDAFIMNMNQDGIGDYQMRSEVVAFEPGRKIAWAPAIHPAGALSHVIGDANPIGHHWIWELEPTAEGSTKVTHTYDWSGVGDESALGLYPRVSQEQLDASVTRLADAVGT